LSLDEIAAFVGAEASVESISSVKSICVKIITTYQFVKTSQEASQMELLLLLLLLILPYKALIKSILCGTRSVG